MARWVERLHPRDARGRFTASSAARRARRAGRRPVSPAAARARRKSYRRTSLQVVGGVAGGAFSAEVGRRQGSRAHTGAGLARVGSALAEGRHNARSARRVTSVAFAAQDPATQRAEIERMNRVALRYRLSNIAGDVGLAQANQNALIRTLTGGITPGQDRARRRESARATRNAGPRRADRRGIYDVTSSPVRKSRRPRGSARAAFKRRTGQTARGRDLAARRRRRNRGRRLF